MDKIHEEIMQEFWKRIHRNDEHWLRNHLGYETGTYALNIENALLKIYKDYLGNPTTIKNLKEQKRLLLLINNQLKDEIKEFKAKLKCENCDVIVNLSNDGFQTGGNRVRLFGWCSKKCCDEFYESACKHRKVKA